MSDLGRKRSSLRTPGDAFHCSGKPIGEELLRFWQWSSSDLLSNSRCGVLAEFIVARALGCDLSEPRDEWAAHDLTTPEGIKVEVKSAAFLQSWNQPKGLSKVYFSIKESLQWDPDTNKQGAVKGRSADVYVFCLLAHTDKATVDPLDLDQWRFFVMSIGTLDSYTRSRHSITLTSLRNLAEETMYGQLSEMVRRALNK